MGLYDTFDYVCPSCNKRTESQTKLGNSQMSVLKIGDEFFRDGKIEMKNTCHNCGTKNMVVIKEGIIISFEKSENPTYIEGY